MTKYNDSLSKAGVLLSLDGLAPPATAVRVKFGGGKTKVVDGPFTESKELVGGYWMIQVKSQEEAIEWAKRAPMLDGDVIEVRRVTEIEDFPPDVRKAAAGSVRHPCDHRCGLADRIRQAHRGSRAGGGRGCRAGGGSGTGGVARGARE